MTPTQLENGAVSVSYDSLEHVPRSSFKKVVMVWIHDIDAYKALPVGLQYMGSQLLRDGYEPKILNLYMPAVVEDLSEEYKELLRQECKDALMLGLSAMTNQAYRSLQVTQFVKDLYPDIINAFEASQL